MAKSKNKRRDRKRRKPFPPDKPTGLPLRTARQRAARAALQAGFPTPEDPTVAAEHMNRAMTYELWLTAGRDISEFPADDLPPAYLRFFADQWPVDAFEFYRHRYFSYLVSVLGTVPWTTYTYSLLRRAGHMDPEGLAELRSVIEGAGERFFRQNANAQELAIAAADAGEPDTRLTSALQAWVACYETDMPLWFLGVMANSLKKGRIRPDYLGGPETATNQGALVDTVAPDLAGTPIELLFALSYDADLRNALAHNDWELVVGENRSLGFLDHRTGRQWSEDDCWDRVQATQLMQQSVLLASQLLLNDSLEPPERFSDVGVLSATSWVLDDAGEPPAVVILQLWCFHELDPRGLWLDGATLTLTHEGEQSVIRLTATASTTGPPRNVETETALRKHSWARVARVPVAPPTGLGLPEVETMEGERFEVVGAPDEHLVPLTFEE